VNEQAVRPGVSFVCPVYNKEAYLEAVCAAMAAQEGGFDREFIFVDDGSRDRSVEVVRDVTREVRLEQMRKDFVANASHELRSPLTVISGYVDELAEDRALAPEWREPVADMRRQAQRMREIVEDLLELSRLESGERPPQWEEVLPSEIVEDVVASFAGLAGRRSIVLTRSSHSAPAVITDADRLRRVMENLVENAIKYTPEGGRVEIVAGPGSDAGTVLEVRDNGPGIATEHLPRIFERFYRVDKARSRELGGTGLGLAIVKHLAEGMGASVTVASEPGKGTVFTVVVPAGAEHASGARPAS